MIGSRNTIASKINDIREETKTAEIVGHHRNGGGGGASSRRLDRLRNKRSPLTSMRQPERNGRKPGRGDGELTPVGLACVTLSGGGGGGCDVVVCRALTCCWCCQPQATTKLWHPAWRGGEAPVQPTQEGQGAWGVAGTRHSHSRHAPLTSMMVVPATVCRVATVRHLMTVGGAVQWPRRRVAEWVGLVWMR